MSFAFLYLQISYDKIRRNKNTHRLEYHSAKMTEADLVDQKGCLLSICREYWFSDEKIESSKTKDKDRTSIKVTWYKKRITTLETAIRHLPLGMSLGWDDGKDEGSDDGKIDGIIDGLSDGIMEGIIDGLSDGILLGLFVGVEDGTIEGASDGEFVGL